MRAPLFIERMRLGWKLAGMMVQSGPGSGIQRNGLVSIRSATSADSMLLPSMAETRAQSEKMYRTMPVARGALRTTATNVLGSGLVYQATPDSEALGLNPDQERRFKTEAERWFAYWAESRESDFARRLTFVEQQGVAFRSQQRKGDCFGILSHVPRPGVPFDLRLQLIDADRVCNPGGASDNDRIAGGIERDKNGVAIGIHVRTPPTRSSGWSRPEWMPMIPFVGPQSGRRNVLHVMEHDWIDQSRGEPDLAPVVDQIKQISKYSQLEVLAAVINAAVVIAITKPDVNASTGQFVGEDKSAESPEELLFAGSQIARLQPGEQLQAVNAARPSTQFDPFFVACMKQIGMALELPFELLLKHFSASYSASRAALLEAWKMFRRRRDAFARSFCQPSLEEALWEGVSLGAIYAPGFLTDPWIRTCYSWASWSGPTTGQIDPVKEVEAAHLREKYGFSSKTIETAMLSGLDFETVAQQRAQERAFERHLGLPGADDEGADPQELMKPDPQEGQNGAN